MKLKKAGKRLDEVESLLSKVIERYATRKPNMLSLLDSAKESVVRAKAALKQTEPRNGRKPPMKAKAAKRQPLANGKKQTVEGHAVSTKTA